MLLIQKELIILAGVKWWMLKSCWVVAKKLLRNNTSLKEAEQWDQRKCTDFHFLQKEQMFIPESNWIPSLKLYLVYIHYCYYYYYWIHESSVSVWFWVTLFTLLFWGLFWRVCLVHWCDSWWNIQQQTNKVDRKEKGSK